jgi:uncharacterized membrane protein HdeD (DUF308 family)
VTALTRESERPEVHDLPDVSSWLLAGGVAHIALGVLALMLAVIATLASVIAFGAILAVGGAVQVVQAARARVWDFLLQSHRVYIYTLLNELQSDTTRTQIPN